MKIISEKVLERKFNKEIKALGGRSFKFLPFIISGLPDRIAFIPAGIVLLAEIKTTGKPLAPRQKIVHAKFKKMGFKVHLIDSYETLEETIEYAKRKKFT